MEAGPLAGGGAEAGVDGLGEDVLHAGLRGGLVEHDRVRVATGPQAALANAGAQPLDEAGGLPVEVAHEAAEPLGVGECDEGVIV